MKLEQIRQALEFYANEENHLEETEGARLVYKSPVAEDRGNRARAALRALGEIEGVLRGTKDSDGKHREAEGVVRVHLRG